MTPSIFVCMLDPHLQRLLLTDHKSADISETLKDIGPYSGIVHLNYGFTLRKNDDEHNKNVCAFFSVSKGTEKLVCLIELGS